MEIIIAHKEDLNIVHNMNNMKYIIDPDICNYFLEYDYALSSENVIVAELRQA